MPAQAADRRRAAVLDSTIAHSLSPALHRAPSRAGLEGWTYDRFDVDEEALPGFFEQLGPEWAGLSLTMPLKRAVIPLLDEITETAASVDAVNTVVLTGDGRKTGDSTDIPGIVAALREHGIEKVETRRFSAPVPPPPPHWPRWPGSAPARSLSTSAARRARRRDAGAGPSGWTSPCASPTGRTPRRRCVPLVVATTPAGATDALAAAVPRCPRPSSTCSTTRGRPTRGPLVGVRRGRRQRTRPAAPPGGAPGGADHGPRPGPARRHAPRGERALADR